MKTTKTLRKIEIEISYDLPFTHNTVMCLSAELEDAEESRFKGSRRCHTSGDHSAADTRYR